MKLVYILSQRYSGSTLLSFLLGTHSDVATIGERRKFYIHSFEKKGSDTLRCSCGQFFPDCEHWKSLKEGVSDRINIKTINTNPTEFRLSDNKYIRKGLFELLKLSLKYNSPLLRIPLQSKLKSFSQFNRVLVEESLKLDGADVFLDSSKVIDHLIFLSMIEAFDIKVVWLTRDPRAQVNSALKYNKWSVADATERWKIEMQENQFWLKKLKINYVSLNYEALCHDPTVEMNRLLNFLELNPEDFSLDFREQTQHIMGNYNMRLGSDSKIVERKEWLETLSQEQIRTIESMTKDYKAYYSKTV
ncbi:sulfotransferase [Roseivirga sp.]|uniref:sulfotransferase n=1 Tax=Roseivirga sp. TaxID=1964215 RepID=UPI003B8AC377